MEEKLIALLECKFSLHEADELFSMLFNNEFTPEDIVHKVDEFTQNNLIESIDNGDEILTVVK